MDAGPENIVQFPWNAQIDPMHQVILGTGKTLSKVLVNSVKDMDYQRLCTLVEKCKTPLEMYA